MQCQCHWTKSRSKEYLHTRNKNCQFQGEEKETIAYKERRRRGSCGVQITKTKIRRKNQSWNDLIVEMLYYCNKYNANNIS